MVEAGSQPGGRARVFKQDGFSFDAGPTVVTAPHLLEELYSLVGRDYRDYFELMPVDPFYRVDFPMALFSIMLATKSAFSLRSRSLTRQTSRAIEDW